MTTHPFIPLYVDDYEAATAHLTPEEDGVYMRLLRLCWRTPGCSIPNDPAWIARKIRVAPADLERIAGPIIEEFFSLKNNRIYQRRLKLEYDAISRKKTARAKAGKCGGDAKARKSKEKEPSNATILPPHTRAFPEPEPEPYTAEVKTSAVPRKGYRLPADWQPSEIDRAYAASKGFSPSQIGTIAERFKNFWTAKSGITATKLDWAATWRNWILDEADRRGAPARKVGFV